MANNEKQSITPPAEFYEDPYLPGALEMQDYLSVPLSPVEAHTILVRMAGGPMSTVDRIALQRIADEDDGDFQQDFLAIRKQVAAELDTDDDWD